MRRGGGRGGEGRGSGCVKIIIMETRHIEAQLDTSPKLLPTNTHSLIQRARAPRATDLHHGGKVTIGWLGGMRRRGRAGGSPAGAIRRRHPYLRETGRWLVFVGWMVASLTCPEILCA